MIYHEITTLLRENGCTCEWVVPKNQNYRELPGAVLEFWKTRGGREFIIELGLSAQTVKVFVHAGEAGNKIEEVFHFLKGFTSCPR